jgi:hypothetical protein
MSRYHGQDVRDKVIELLNNGWTNRYGEVIPGLTGMLSVIDTERTQTTPSPKKIGYDWLENQRPYVLVDLEDSELIQDEELTDNLDLTPEIWTCNLLTKIKSNNVNLHNYIENYIEAISRILNGYNGEFITWILITGTNRSELYQDVNQSAKMGQVTCQIRVN